MSAPSLPATPRRPVLLAAGVCLMIAVAAFLLIRGMDSPWGGKLGRSIFGQDVYKMSSIGAHRGLIDFYFDPTHPARAKMTVGEWARVGLRLSSTLVLLVAVLGAATARWWARWLIPLVPAQRPPAARVPRWSWLVLLAALALGASLRLPAAWQYVTYDEQDNMRRNYHGFLDFEKPGEAPKWVEAGFADALWENDRVNNPFFFSTLSQLSQAGWRAITGEPRQRFSLPAMRLPSLVFGTAAIVAVWWMMNTLGLVRQAPWAALLMAVHALAIHHSVEARGYGMCMFLACLLLGMAWRVLHGGRGREWACYGVLVCSCIFTYPGSLYYVASLNVFVATVLAWRWRKLGDDTARAGLARWFIANVAAGMAFLWIIAPAVPQAMAEFHEKFPTGNLTASWAVGAFVTYGTGLMGIFSPPGDPDAWTGPSHLAWHFSHFPRFWPIAVIAACVFPLLLACGIRALWRQGRLRAALLATAALSGCLMFTHHSLITDYCLYHWYIIYVLPAVLGIQACGITAVGAAIANRWHQPGDAIAAALATALACWLLAISFNWPGSREWNDGIVYFSRQPPRGGWAGPAAQIERSEIPRGSSLWVTYKDGYLCRFRDYEKNAAAWESFRVRGTTDWGKPPGSPR